MRRVKFNKFTSFLFFLMLLISSFSILFVVTKNVKAVGFDVVGSKYACGQEKYTNDVTDTYWGIYVKDNHTFLIYYISNLTLLKSYTTSYSNYYNSFTFSYDNKYMFVFQTDSSSATSLRKISLFNSSSTTLTSENGGIAYYNIENCHYDDYLIDGFKSGSNYYIKTLDVNASSYITTVYISETQFYDLDGDTYNNTFSFYAGNTLYIYDVNGNEIKNKTFTNLYGIVYENGYLAVAHDGYLSLYLDSDLNTELYNFSLTYSEKVKMAMTKDANLIFVGYTASGHNPELRYMSNGTIIGTGNNYESTFPAFSDNGTYLVYHYYDGSTYHSVLVNTSYTVGSGGSSGSSSNPPLPTHSQWLHFGERDTGLYAYGFTAGTSYQYLEYERKIPMTINIKQLDIAFSTDFFDSNRTNTTLFAYINGNNIGNPTVTTYTGTYNNISLAEWTGLNIQINNSYPVIELNETVTKNGYYWWGIGVWQEDKDIDGEYILNLHNAGSLYGNGVDEGQTNKQYEVAYSIWYTIEGSNIEDTLHLSDTSIQQYDTLNIHYTANLENTKYLVVTNNTDVEVFNQTLSNTEGDIAFTPLPSYGSGIFTVHISNATGVYSANESFTVTSLPSGSENWGIWVSNKNPLPNEEFIIYYIAPTNMTGEIDIYKGSTLEYTTNIQGDNNTHSFKKSYSDGGTYDIELFNVVNGTTYLKDTETVVIGSQYAVNNINVNVTLFNLGGKVKIYGETSYVGYNVYVKVLPSGYTYPITSTDYSFTYQPSYASDYYAYLMLDNQELDSIHFVVVTSGATSENPLITNFNYILATAIILIFAVLGIAISNKVNTEQRWLITSIFTAIGFYVCIVYSLIPLWLPFLVSLFVIVYIVREVL